MYIYNLALTALYVPYSLYSGTQPYPAHPARPAPGTPTCKHRAPTAKSPCFIQIVKDLADEVTRVQV